MDEHRKASFMKIGELAKRLKVSPRTVRYYEELGIITPHRRTSGHFRLYSQKELKKMVFIQNLKLLDFPLERIKEFLTLPQSTSRLSNIASQLLEILNEQLKETEEKLKQYRIIKKNLKDAIEITEICASCQEGTQKYPKCQDCDTITSKGEIPLTLQVFV